MSIDYDLEWPDEYSFTVDHYSYPRSTHPHLAEDPGALAAAHLKCNQHAGERPPAPGLGVLSENW
jgi:hypothetical protein